jgi:hypothetical protein
MSKVAKILTVAAVLVALAVTTVAAQTSSSTAFGSPPPTTSKQCYSLPCHGNFNRETIYERIGDGKRDLIRAYGNFDRIHANTYTNDVDQGYGYGGSDYIYVNDGDTLDGSHGGWGHDRCYVDAEIEAGNDCERVIVR